MRGFLLGGLGVLVSGFLAGTARAEPGDLIMAKIACHLEPGTFTKVCFRTPPSDFRCNDDPTSPAVVTTHGEVGGGYLIYVLALDVLPAAGLGSVSFAIEYPPELDVLGFASCQGTGVAHAGWPASGGGITLTFDPCRGTEPDPSDPEGDASVVLGVFSVTADDDARLNIRPRFDTHEKGVILTNCAGDPTDITKDRAAAGYSRDFVYLGEITFGGAQASQGGICAYNGVADCSCYFGPYVSHVCCCSGDGAYTDYMCTSTRECAYHGGDPIWAPCTKRCDEVCGDVTAKAATWSAIKARHD